MVSKWVKLMRNVPDFLSLYQINQPSRGNIAIVQINLFLLKRAFSVFARLPSLVVTWCFLCFHSKNIFDELFHFSCTFFVFFWALKFNHLERPSLLIFDWSQINIFAIDFCIFSTYISPRIWKTCASAFNFLKNAV